MHENRPHLILFGGFLGAGKTAAMLALARWLPDQGLRATFITNDQGSNLADTHLLRSCGLTTEEIPGGCFCCRFDEFVGATRRRGVLPPDVIVAEAVGSCTDLAATVASPIRRLLADECTVAPLSVLVDPLRGRLAFGLDRGETFTDEIQYIYRKQLEEADVIVVTKSDTLPAEAIEELQQELARNFPGLPIELISSHRGTGCDQWFRRIVFEEQRSRPLMAIDYDRYADGEALLGWVNAHGIATTTTPGDGNAFLLRLMDDLRRGLAEHDVEVAHLKMTLLGEREICAMNLVGSARELQPTMTMTAPIQRGQLTVNLRAEAPPEILEQLVRATLTTTFPWVMQLHSVEAFRPGRPTPTHRDGNPPLSPS